MKHILKQLVHTLGRVVFFVYAVQSNRKRRSEKPDPDSIRKILVIRLDLMGDLVFSLPAVAALADAFPSARIDMLVLPYAADLLVGVPDVAAIHVLDVNAYRRPSGWRRVARLVRVVQAIRREQYDVAIGLSGLMGGVFAALSGARLRVGYGAESYPGAYNMPVRGRRYAIPQHEVDYCLDLVRSVATLDAPPTHVPSLPSRALSASTEDAYAVIVPGASNGAAKRWPASHWSMLGNRIAAELDLRVVVSGAASERRLAGAVAEQIGQRAENRAGATSVRELAQLIAGASIVVAGDTGPLHVAAALGVPVVGIFGPTDPINTGPLSSAARVLRLGLPCSPCYDLRSPADCKLPSHDMPCMRELSPSLVFDAIASLLRERERATASDR